MPRSTPCSCSASAGCPAFFKQAQKTAHIAGASHDEGGALNGLGITYGRLGDYAQALTHHQRALTIGTSTNDARVTAHALRGAALSYFRFGRIEEALAHFHQAFDGLDGADYRDQRSKIRSGISGP